ncbi:MAG TPA: CdaR family protein [Thermomicrobiales bacterium]|jgi:YbbR domain-containing protein
MVQQRLGDIRKRLGVGILSRGLFAILLAILLWGWVTTQDDPEIERPFTAITPTIINKADNLVILDEAKIPSITVTVRGPRSELNRLTTLDIPVEIDLGEIKAPTSANIQVSARVVGHRGVRVTGTAPETVAISTDLLVSKTFPIEIEKGQPILPYSVGNVDPNPKQIEVRGPQRQVSQIARVVLPVGLGDRRDNFEAQFTPEARDTSGARINGVTLEPGSVAATVTVERIGRTVSIVPNIQGTPADGYRVGNPRISPPSITIDGPPDLLSQLIVISTVPIDVSGKREAFSVYGVALNLPAGTRVIDRNTINVEVPIEAELQQQQIGGVKVNVLVDPGYRATVTPSEIAVNLSGPRERIRQLSAGEVTAQIDLRGTGPGSYERMPTITKPDELSADPAPPVRVVVERIPASPTIAPTATPRPTPTPTVPPPPSAPPSTAPSGYRENAG